MARHPKVLLRDNTALLQDLHRDSMEHLQARTVATSKRPQARPRHPVLAMSLDRPQT